MKFLVLADDYTGIIVHNRLTSENHEVVYVNSNHRNNGISTVANVHQGIAANPDVAICCSNRFPLETHIIKSKGIPIFGGSQLDIALETNDEIREKFIKDHNIRWKKDTTKELYPISIELWFSNGDPLYQYIGFIKQNRFLAGDLGKETNGESVALWAYNTRNCLVVERIFGNGLFHTLEKIKYSGVLSFDSVISEDDKYPYVYRINSRLQALVLTAMLEIYTEDFGVLIYNILHKKQQSIILQDKVSISVTVSQPPYPYDNLQGLVKYVIAADENWIIARKKIAKQIKELDIKDIQYRIDAGLQAEFIDELKRINYINN